MDSRPKRKTKEWAMSQLNSQKKKCKKPSIEADGLEVVEELSTPEVSELSSPDWPGKKELDALKGKYLMSPPRQEDGKKCCVIVGSGVTGTKGLCGWEAVGLELRRHGLFLGQSNTAKDVMSSLANFLRQ